MAVPASFLVPGLDPVLFGLWRTGLAIPKPHKQGWMIDLNMLLSCFREKMPGRLCCLVHGELAWLFLEPDTGLHHCPRILLLCFRSRTSGPREGRREGESHFSAPSPPPPRNKSVARARSFRADGKTSSPPGRGPPADFTTLGRFGSIEEMGSEFARKFGQSHATSVS